MCYDDSYKSTTIVENINPDTDKDNVLNKASLPTDDSELQYKRMGSGKLLPLVISFGIPATITQLIQISYNMADTIFVGNRVGSEGLAALLMVLPLIIFFMALSILFAMGANTIFSIKLGENKLNEAKRLVGTTLAINAVLSIIVGFIFYFGTEYLLKLSGATGLTLTYAITYLQIYGSCFFACNMGYTINGFIQSSGAPRRAMLTHAIAAGINIVLDYIFICIFDWGVAGAAWATVIGWSFACLVALQYFFSQKAPFVLDRSCFNFIDFSMRDRVTYSLPVFLMQLGNVAMLFVYVYIVRWHSADYAGGESGALAMFSVCNRLCQFIMIPSLGFGMGCMTLMGYNFGAKLYERLRSLLLVIVTVATVCMVVLWLPMMIWTSPILMLFGLSGADLTYGTTITRICICIVPSISIEVVAGMYCQATGRIKEGSLLLSARSFWVAIPVMVVFPWLLVRMFDMQALTALAWAFFLIDILLLIPSLYILAREIKRFGRPQSELSGCCDA